MSDIIVTIGEEETAPVVIITPGETVLPTASVQVQTQEETPVVHVHVDENSAQSAADSAAAAQAALNALANTDITKCIEKAEFSESTMTGDSYMHFGIPQYSSIRFVGDSTIFKGVYLFPGYKAYSGKKLTLKNFQTTDILLKHLANDPLLNTNLYFPNQTDYILKPGKIIEFSLSMIANRFEFIGDSEDISGKEDKSNKGIAGGYVPLNSAVKIASEYLSIVNDLITGGATSLLSAEQGKQLKIQINAINTLLTSDNVNLDTLQELVDAIETVQTSLSAILVNDLTTGGVTKALTAEMGKSLKVLIDDLTTVVSGKQASLTDVNFGSFQSALPTVTIIADTNKMPFLVGSLSRMMTWANFKILLQTFMTGLFARKDRLLENASVTGSYALDYASYELWNLVLTGNTTLTESNLEQKTILIRCTGNFALTFPSGWSTDISGTYKGTAQNTIVVQHFKTGVYKVSIIQPY